MPMTRRAAISDSAKRACWSGYVFQILGFIALEPPSRIGADELRSEKHALFQALRSLDPHRAHVFMQ